MSYSFLIELIELTERFELEFSGQDRSMAAFARWLFENTSAAPGPGSAVSWEGRENGRSVESVINTSLVHLFRYAKIYSKIAISGSPFTTIDEVIFLLNLLHLGSMTKIELIELNIHEKSTGIQVINRLLDKGFVAEVVNEKDRRSKKISVTPKGQQALETNMHKVRQASKRVTGNLTENEKLQLVSLLQKLDVFHKEKMKTGSLEL